VGITGTGTDRYQIPTYRPPVSPSPSIRFREAAADASRKSNVVTFHCDNQTSVYLLQMIKRR
jgi:hypothetical protein